MRYWKVIADNLSKAGWSLSWVSAVDSQGQTIWIVDAHRDERRFIVHADEKLSAFVELESASRRSSGRTQLVTKPGLAAQFAPQHRHAEQSAPEQRNCRATVGHPSFDDEREVLVR